MWIGMAVQRTCQILNCLTMCAAKKSINCVNKRATFALFKIVASMVGSTTTALPVTQWFRKLCKTAVVVAVSPSAAHLLTFLAVYCVAARLNDWANDCILVVVALPSNIVVILTVWRRSGNVTSHRVLPHTSNFRLSGLPMPKTTKKEKMKYAKIEVKYLHSFTHYGHFFGFASN